MAQEPEITDLANFLNAMGAKIRGAGTARIEIEGVRSLHGAEYSIMPDRIAAITYLCGAAATGGNITLTKVVPEHLESALTVLAKCGCKIEVRESSISLEAPQRLTSPGSIVTTPYPGFPTDAQSLFLALFCIADGTSTVQERIFTSRFKPATELAKMGAHITVVDDTATVTGVPLLNGAHVTAMDLRGGAALVIAALSANGISVIDKVCYIDRGYENLEKNLRLLGATVKRID